MQKRTLSFLSAVVVSSIAFVSFGPHVQAQMGPGGQNGQNGQGGPGQGQGQEAGQGQNIRMMGQGMQENMQEGMQNMPQGRPGGNTPPHMPGQVGQNNANNASSSWMHGSSTPGMMGHMNGGMEGQGMGMGQGMQGQNMATQPGGMKRMGVVGKVTDIESSYIVMVGHTMNNATTTFTVDLVASTTYSNGSSSAMLSDITVGSMIAANGPIATSTNTITAYHISVNVPAGMAMMGGDNRMGGMHGNGMQGSGSGSGTPPQNHPGQGMQNNQQGQGGQGGQDGQSGGFFGRVGNFFGNFFGGGNNNSSASANAGADVSAGASAAGQSSGFFGNLMQKFSNLLP